ncbi:hypothetical protein CsSME_00028550 [Camellia sinensis var. sinensis]
MGVLGSGLIVMALYAVLWGKNKEMNAKNNVEEDREEEKQEVVKSDLEMQFCWQSQSSYNQKLSKEIVAMEIRFPLFI